VGGGSAANAPANRTTYVALTRNGGVTGLALGIPVTFFARKLGSLQLLPRRPHI
jgi:hypothetical protein